jgi:hypothetical protein
MPRPINPEDGAWDGSEPTAPAGHPFDAEIEAERVGWRELPALIHSLKPAEISQPGYRRDW